MEQDRVRHPDLEHLRSAVSELRESGFPSREELQKFLGPKFKYMDFGFHSFPTPKSEVNISAGKYSNDGGGLFRATLYQEGEGASVNMYHVSKVELIKGNRYAPKRIVVTGQNQETFELNMKTMIGVYDNSGNQTFMSFDFNPRQSEDK